MKDFNNTIESWIKEIDKYDFLQLSDKPSPGSWSLGQVCMHLLQDTNFYIEQIHACITTNDHAHEEATEDGKTMLANNDFPDAIIEGAPSNAHVPQPESKEWLMARLVDVRDEMKTLRKTIQETMYIGKTKHPGLGYFSAAEWFQFAGMHFRHHLRQKKRIDEFLKNNRGLG